MFAHDALTRAATPLAPLAALAIAAIAESWIVGPPAWLGAGDMSGGMGAVAAGPGVGAYGEPRDGSATGPEPFWLAYTGLEVDREESLGAVAGVQFAPGAWRAASAGSAASVPSAGPAAAEELASGLSSGVAVGEPSPAASEGSTRFSTPSSSAQFTDLRLSPRQPLLIRPNQIPFDGSAISVTSYVLLALHSEQLIRLGSPTRDGSAPPALPASLPYPSGHDTRWACNDAGERLTMASVLPVRGWRITPPRRYRPDRRHRD